MKEIFVYYGGNQTVPKDVERVRIDPSVKVIVKGAFEYCRNLKYVQYCEGVQEIGDSAFRLCTSLESVRMASTTRIIHKAAFQSCSKLRYLLLNEGLEVIGLEAFENCESIEFLELPSTMRHIQNRAFRYCTGLSKAVFNENLVEVGTGAFQYCTNWKTLVAPSGSYKTKFGHGSKKWMPYKEGSKDKTFWDLVASNADHADKVIMANCGMLPPSDRDYLLPTNEQNKSKVDLETRLAQEQKRQQELVSTLESWKKSHFALQAQFSSLQFAYCQIVAREQDALRRLQIMTAHHYSMGPPPIRTEPAIPLSSSTTSVGQTSSMKPSVPKEQVQSQENMPSGVGKDKPMRNNTLKRKTPMQDSTNQQKDVKKVRPVC